MSRIKVTKPSEQELEKLRVRSWGTWGCDVSRFDWEYADDETCYVTEGHVVVETDEGATEIKAGDLVTFPRGLKCVWDVKAPIRKHFKFG